LARLTQAYRHKNGVSFAPHRRGVKGNR